MNQNILNEANQIAYEEAKTWFPNVSFRDVVGLCEDRMTIEGYK